jgi:hypothetical protein
MPKYIVEQISAFRNVHVVEAENEDAALAIADQADDNWQEWLGSLKIDITNYTDERISFFKDKDYFWDGVSYKDADGFIGYIHPSGEKVERKEIKVK